MSGGLGEAQTSGGFLAEVRDFDRFGRRSARPEPLEVVHAGRSLEVPVLVNEFWTAKQRQADGLHEVSYRACFKPQLPAFFIDRLTRPGDAVFDPFMGRGTTPLEAALRGRVPLGNDLSPLSRHLALPRLDPPEEDEVAARLAELDLTREVDPGAGPPREDLLCFFHPDTLRELMALRAWLLEREAANALDRADRWLRMVAMNRLTGHSGGFFSVYTLPPNQAVSATAQRAINEKLGQTPPRRPIAERILKKTRALLRDVDATTRATLRSVHDRARLFTGPAERVALPDASVDLVVTSPPFLDVVDYAGDNWLRGWFCGVDPRQVALTTPRGLTDWREAMTAALREVRRLLRPGGHVAFETGEVRSGAVRLDEATLPCAVEAGLRPLLVMINDQRFTKTANCWGVTNRVKGTNTNRIGVFIRD